ncbi:MAG: NAD(P)/FAD-dependent oxidoreductase [Candidatus Dormibacteraceae bacterium]
MPQTTDPVWGVSPGDRRGSLPEQADVLVVGGGIAGVSTLWWLRQSGRSGVLVEADRLAFGASGRNAGVIGSGPNRPYAAAVRDFGRARVAEITAFTLENHERLVEALAGRSPNYRRRGGQTWPVDGEEAALLEESAELEREDGFGAEWNGRCLVHPHNGEHNPVETVLALASDAPEGSIREGVRVTGLESSADGVLVETRDGGSCRAAAVVIALNAYTPQLLPEVPIAPTRAQALATAPVAHQVAPCPQGRDHGYQYWNQLADGRVVAGGYRNLAIPEEVGYEMAITPTLQSALERHLVGIEADQPVTHRWAGIMGFTELGLPLVGPAPGRPNVYLCAGFTGHGFATSFLSARNLVRHLDGETSDPIVPWAALHS